MDVALFQAALSSIEGPSESGRRPPQFFGGVTAVTAEVDSFQVGAAALFKFRTRRIKDSKPPPFNIHPAHCSRVRYSVDGHPQPRRCARGGIPFRV